MTVEKKSILHEQNQLWKTNKTVFRFFTGISNSASFKIYNAAGFLVDDFNIVGLQNHQYNEYSYNASY